MVALVSTVSRLTADIRRARILVHHGTYSQYDTQYTNFTALQNPLVEIAYLFDYCKLLTILLYRAVQSVPVRTREESSEQHIKLLECMHNMEHVRTVLLVPGSRMQPYVAF